MVPAAWNRGDSPEAMHVREESRAAIDSYVAKPKLLDEQFNLERSVVESGYRRAQLNELVQNATDAMDGLEGRLRIVLTDGVLYCANEGSPFRSSGITSIMMAHASGKRGKEIGRYGLGFKSVLELTDAPEIISRSVSFRWSQEITRTALADRGIDHPGPVPLLRVAEVFNPEIVADDDPVLAEMMEWATTVIRVPLRPGAAGALSEEAARFPGEFILFSDSVGQLEIIDKTRGTVSNWTAERPGSTTVDLGMRQESPAGEEVSTTRWRVFSQEHRPSARARQAAGDRNSRDVFEVQWAVPAEIPANPPPGKLWSYFPSHSEISLRGIVNAPFHMADDRHDVISGTYNEEILRRTLPVIVAGALGELSDPHRPNLHFRLLPSRDREFASWADEVSNAAIFTACASSRCLPNLAGEMRFPSELRVPPQLTSTKDAELAEARDLWYELAHETLEADSEWIHEDVFKDSHLGTPLRVRRILTAASITDTSPQDLLEALAAPRSLAGYRNALRFAAEIDRRHVQWAPEMRRSRFVPTSDGGHQPPLARSILLPDPTDASPSASTVILDVVQDGESLKHLKALGITGQDEEGQLRRAITEARNSGTATEFQVLWDAVHRVREIRSAHEQLHQSIPDPAKLLVRFRDGHWRPLSEAWRTGPIFSTTPNPADDRYVIDAVFHRLDLSDLMASGLRSALPESAPSDADKSFSAQWTKSVRTQALAKATETGWRLAPGDVKLGRVQLTPGLLDLAEASEATRQRVTNELVERHSYVPSPTTDAGHKTWSTKVLTPDAWWVREYGVTTTPLGTMPVGLCTTGEGLPASFPRSMLPIPNDLGSFHDVVLPPTPPAEAWARIFSTILEGMRRADQAHDLYAHAAAASIRRPKQLRAQDSHGLRFVDAEFCAVTHSDLATAHLLSKDEKAVIQVSTPDLAAGLTSAWKLEHVNPVFTRAVPEDTHEEPHLLVERYPHVGKVDPRLKRLKVALADDVVLRTTNSYDDTVDDDTSNKYLLTDDFVLVIRRESAAQELKFALKAVRSKLDLPEAKQIMKKAEEEDRLRLAQSKETDADRLLTWFGEENFRQIIPASVRTMVEENLGKELETGELFDVAQAMYGFDLFKRLNKLRGDDSVLSPQRLAGGARALEFMDLLGVDAKYAGKSMPAPPPQEVVVGPVRLDPLHDFQEDVSAQILPVLTGTGPRRAMVQLPTGAGKTRVAVQTVIDRVREFVAPPAGHVLWIAQTEELCEQAVGTWMSVWRAFGPTNENLTISRFWGSRPQREVMSSVGLHVVVSTPQTAGKLFAETAEATRWFRRPSIVILDEAHGAEARTSRQILQALRRSDVPVIGLSATPYRGTDERSTQNLVKLFDENLLRPSQFDLVDASTYLQRNGYLAEVDHYTLEGIALRKAKQAMKLADEDPFARMEEAQLDLKAVAENSTRNNTIINDVLERGGDRKTLLFAASVEHAHALAAVLSYRGMRASAIDGAMSIGARREEVQRFKDGDVQVLTNFNVLSQGFDVPDVNAVYVCRPTFVPNRYLQMIGRGLRGPKNGGTERVDIVNVADNAETFGTSLAFTHFDHLWNRRPAALEPLTTTKVSS